MPNAASQGFPMSDRHSTSHEDTTRATASFRLVVEYDGTDYAGWQVQREGVKTVQSTLEKSLQGVLQERVRCFGAGRTDVGVHALGQVVRFDTAKTRISPYEILRGANHYLPFDIRVVSVDVCPPDFDPRGNAILRWYRYSILNRQIAPALDRHRLYHIPRTVDWDLVQRALDKLKGHHDFSAFRSSHCTAKRTVLTLQTAQHIDQHPLHHIDLKCRSFLQRMVRIIVGIVLEIGMGKHEISVIDEMLATQKRSLCFRTAPAHGLTLMNVDYGKDTADFLANSGNSG